MDEDIVRLGETHPMDEDIVRSGETAHPHPMDEDIGRLGENDGGFIPSQDEEHEKAGTKRKMVATSDQVSKIHKPEGSVFSSKGTRKEHESQPMNTASNLETKLDSQLRKIRAIRDALKEHVATSVLRKMLEANEQDSDGSELNLCDRCADGMLFGALTKCPICSGPVRYSGGSYRCYGYLSPWNKCSYSTTAPERLKEKWRIPEETSNVYLLKWFKSQERLPFVAETSKSIVTVKVEGRSLVHEASVLQDTGHIPEVGRSIYNTTLNKSDLSTEVNRKWAKLQKVRGKWTEHLQPKKMEAVNAYLNCVRAIRSSTPSASRSGESWCTELSHLKDLCSFLEDDDEKSYIASLNAQLAYLQIFTKINAVHKYFWAVINSEDGLDKSWILKKLGGHHRMKFKEGLVFAYESERVLKSKLRDLFQPNGEQVPKPIWIQAQLSSVEDASKMDMESLKVFYEGMEETYASAISNVEKLSTWSRFLSGAYSEVERLVRYFENDLPRATFEQA